MKKVLILAIVAVFLVLFILFFSRRRQTKTVAATKPNAKIEIKRPSSYVDIVLNKEKTLMSYAILAKNITQNIREAYFESDGIKIKQVSGPIQMYDDQDEVILHGLWRSTEARALSKPVIEKLEAGNLKVVIYFENDKDVPFEIAILGPGD